MHHVENSIRTGTAVFNWIAALAVFIMMVLTCADVVLRFFRHPIPGTYEIVGLLGTVVISFALAYTTAEKGHIAVEFVVMRFSPRVQHHIDTINALIGAGLFGLMSWQSILYGLDLKASGEVSLTVQMPVYPFVLAIGAGCGLACLVLGTECVTSLRKVRMR